MTAIIPFTEEENYIIEIIQSRIKNNNFPAIRNNINSLMSLAEAISLYPSILSEQTLGKESRSIKTLVDNLRSGDFCDNTLRIPSKAILGKSFIIAKINFFLMLLYLCAEDPGLKSAEAPIRTGITSNIFSLMAEDVFISILSDNNTGDNIKTYSGYLLANIWEHRIHYGVGEFAPSLLGIWAGRKKIQPALGTLLGISELFSLARNADSTFFDFLENSEIDENKLASLKEFLIGLSYEDIKKLSLRMEKEKISSISSEQISGEGINGSFREDDPRIIYASFTFRRMNSSLRRRAGLEGPHKTFEEYLMNFILSRQLSTDSGPYSLHIV